MLQIVEIDDQVGRILFHGLNVANERFLQELSEDYASIEPLVEGLFEAADYLEASHFADTYLRYNPEAPLVYRENRNMRNDPVVKHWRGFIVATLRNGGWPDEQGQYALFLKPGFQYARMTADPDQTAQLSIVSLPSSNLIRAATESNSIV
ncbi:hypothetical protein [Pelagicoccus sp. SDUM812002]|uniref:hypothetical protein n=1 Tax=Pelagicoccus sp. SDUM812002 TaxID=3041266 RepID=UPI00280EEACD|nr:hypothetical protein [Pelagicoccus sp. SDUM812002]MDQ8183948.1 hypothetical protein [Pelagicoccus sp. SDUM812002]